jgi:hypothetical protein
MRQLERMFQEEKVGVVENELFGMEVNGHQALE